MDGADHPQVRLTRRWDGTTAVVEDDTGTARATCAYRFGMLKRVDADGVAHRIEGRWWKAGAFDAVDASTGRTVLTLRQLTIAVDGGPRLRCVTTSKDGGPRPHRADEARMTVTDAGQRTVMVLTWDGEPGPFGTSTKTFRRGTAEVDPVALGTHLGLVTAVAFHLFSTGRGGAG